MNKIRAMKKPVLLVILLLVATIGAGFRPGLLLAAGGRSERPVYRSPLEVAFSPDSRLLAVSDHTAGSAVLVDATTAEVVREVKLKGKPAGIAWSADGRFVYVAECGAGTVAEIDRAGKIVRRLNVGPRPMGLSLAARRGWLAAANSATHTVSLLALADGREKARVAVPRVPYMLAVTPDEKTAVVGNRLPAGDASDPSASAAVTLIDLESPGKAAHIRLPPNSVNVHGVAISPDGRWAYVVHNLGRAMLPTEQIEYGWINANAMTVIDLAAQRAHGGLRRYATILLDRAEEGAANPWGAAVSRDGSVLWIALAGVHQLGRFDLAGLHKALRREMPEILALRRKAAQAKDEESTARGAMAYSAGSQAGLDDPSSVEVVFSDLPVEYGQGKYIGGVFTRVDLPGNGPRGLAISADGKRLAVAMYFTGTVLLVDQRTGKVAKVVPIADQPAADDARLGELIFHDARRCFQHWLSCSTCHPDGRADGLNWDLLNDGIGNAKNTRSMLLSHRTPPAMWRGVRADMEVAARAGFQFILFQGPEPGELRAVAAYLRSLEPAESPYLSGGRLSEKARRGKAVFDGPRTRCAVCHPAPLYTDLKLHDVGTRLRWDASGRFDTPSLIELWRTAPYLHHGRAKTLREVVAELNEEDKHGRTSHLSSEQIDALVEYLRSL